MWFSKFTLWHSFGPILYEVWYKHLICLYRFFITSSVLWYDSVAHVVIQIYILFIYKLRFVLLFYIYVSELVMVLMLYALYVSLIHQWIVSVDVVPLVTLFSRTLWFRFQKNDQNICFDAYHCPFVCNSLLFVGFLQFLLDSSHSYEQRKKTQKKFHTTVSILWIFKFVLEVFVCASFGLLMHSIIRYRNDWCRFIPKTRSSRQFA